MVLFSCIIGAGLVYVLFFARLFDVRVVEVKTPSAISTDAVRESAWSVLHQRSFGLMRQRNGLLFSPQEIRPTLLRTFPRIDHVEITRLSMHVLEITVHERMPVGLWCLTVQQVCYYYDSNGTAFSQILPSSGFLYVPVNDARNRTIILGSAVAPESLRNDIFEVKGILQFGDVIVSQINIPADAYHEYTVVTREGWNIRYSMDTDNRKQTNNLLVFLKEKLSPSTRANLDYVDLRIEDRITYKER